MLDLIYTNCDGNSWVLDKFTSDHKCVLFEFMSEVEKVIRHKLKKRTYKGYNPQIISEKVNEELLSQSFTGDADFDCDLLTNTVIDVLDKLHPLRTIRTSRKTDIVDQELEKMKKKRKRLLKKFNKDQDSNCLSHINQLNKRIKARIKDARSQQINLRLQGKNPRSFWNAVAEIEGKKKDENLMLTINNELVTDSLELAKAFGDFFLSKVDKLAGKQQTDNYMIGHSPLNITINEINKASKSMKSKLCHGEDEIPMKVIKDLSFFSPALFEKLFNSCCTTGIPASWKVALVRPLHKKGPKDAIENYRPISNLNSIGKLFEKVILTRIEELGDLDGLFQHGFKKGRSTTTAMLELQDFVASELDKNNIVGTYSIDLSAAFDLLKPDVFFTTMQHKIPLNLMQVILDFLSERSFKVIVDNCKSGPKSLSLGCVQGSILGPRLFTLYMSELVNNLPKDVHIVSYADDTYVSISSPNLPILKEKLSYTMLKHDHYLKSIGMVTNVNKTELIYFSRSGIHDAVPLKVGQDSVIPQKTIKVLGITFDQDLSWNTHATKIKQKAAMTMRKVKFLGKFVDYQGMKKIITTHLFGMIYYASVVWLSELTTVKFMNSLDSIHYKGLRVAAKDYYHVLSRQRLDDIFNRASPLRWMQYSTAKHALCMISLNQKGPPMSYALNQKLYINDRNPKKISIHDTSRLKVGRNSFHNRLKCLKCINFDWKDITPHTLRMNLKKTFFK